MLKLHSKKAQIPALELVLLFFIGVALYSLFCFYLNEESKQEKLLVARTQAKAMADFSSSAIIINMLNRECVDAFYTTIVIQMPIRLARVSYLIKLENDTIEAELPPIKENATLFNLHYLNQNLEGVCESTDISCSVMTNANQTKIFS